MRSCRTDASAALSAIPGVSKVTVADQHEQFTGYEVESESTHDVRRDVARTIVDQGWGLLELRPTRMSLEQIFLELTTEDPEENAQQAQPGGNAA